MTFSMKKDAIYTLVDMLDIRIKYFSCMALLLDIRIEYLPSTALSLDIRLHYFPHVRLGARCQDRVPPIYSFVTRY